MVEGRRIKATLTELIKKGFPESFVDNMGLTWRLNLNGHSFLPYKLPVGYPGMGRIELPACADYEAIGPDGERIEMNLVKGYWGTEEEEMLKEGGMKPREVETKLEEPVVVEEMGTIKERRRPQQKKDTRKSDKPGRNGRRGGRRG